MSPESSLLQNSGSELKRGAHGRIDHARTALRDVLVSAIVVGVSLRAAIRLGDRMGMPPMWWLPSPDLARDISWKGWLLLGTAVVSLAFAYRQRSHSRVASTVLGACVAVLFIVLDLWARPPGDHFDARPLTTVMWSLGPLYVGSLGLLTHLAVWGAGLRVRSANGGGDQRTS